VADAADPRDRRGKEDLTAADVRWTAETKPSGLLVGMGVVQQVASPRGYKSHGNAIGRRAAGGIGLTGVTRHIEPDALESEPPWSFNSRWPLRVTRC
jgi:hypothetical protein